MVFSSGGQHLKLVNAHCIYLVEDWVLIFQHYLDDILIPPSNKVGSDILHPLFLFVCPSICPSVGGMFSGPYLKLLCNFNFKFHMQVPHGGLLIFIVKNKILCLFLYMIFRPKHWSKVGHPCRPLIIQFLQFIFFVWLLIWNVLTNMVLDSVDSLPVLKMTTIPWDVFTM